MTPGSRSRLDLVLFICVRLRQWPQDQTGDPVVVVGGGGGRLHRWPLTPARSARLPGRAPAPRGDRGLARLIIFRRAAATSRDAGDLISHIPSRTTVTATGRHWAASLTAAGGDDATDATDATDAGDGGSRINHVSVMTDDG